MSQDISQNVVVSEITGQNTITGSQVHRLSQYYSTAQNNLTGSFPGFYSVSVYCANADLYLQSAPTSSFTGSGSGTFTVIPAGQPFSKGPILTKAKPEIFVTLATQSGSATYNYYVCGN